MPRKMTTTQQGYGVLHQRLRKRWEPKVRAGLVDCMAVTCLEPHRFIAPDMPWDLGHTVDRTGYTGPEHQRCNRSDGGRRGAAVTNGQMPATRTSRQW